MLHSSALILSPVRLYTGCAYGTPAVEMMIATSSTPCLSFGTAFALRGWPLRAANPTMDPCKRKRLRVLRPGLHRYGCDLTLKLHCLPR